MESITKSQLASLLRLSAEQISELAKGDYE